MKARATMTETAVLNQGADAVLIFVVTVPIDVARPLIDRFLYEEHDVAVDARGLLLQTGDDPPPRTGSDRERALEAALWAHIGERAPGCECDPLDPPDQRCDARVLRCGGAVRAAFPLARK